MRDLTKAVLFSCALAVGCSSPREVVAPQPPANAFLNVRTGPGHSPCYIVGPPILPEGKSVPITANGSTEGIYVRPGGPFTITQGFAQLAVDPDTHSQYSCTFSGYLWLESGQQFQSDGCTTSSVPSDHLALTCTATWEGVAP